VCSSDLLVQVIDAVAPTTVLTAAPLALGGNDFLLEWTVTDDTAGSGVKHVTIYVAEDGGDFRILEAQSTDTSLVFEGEAGKTYEFLALATDVAGNREQPPLGISAVSDDGNVNLGIQPDLEDTPPNFGIAPPPAVTPGSESPSMATARAPAVVQRRFFRRSV